MTNEQKKKIISLRERVLSTEKGEDIFVDLGQLGRYPLCNISWQEGDKPTLNPISPKEDIWTKFEEVCTPFLEKKAEAFQAEIDLLIEEGNQLADEIKMDYDEFWPKLVSTSEFNMENKNMNFSFLEGMLDDLDQEQMADLILALIEAKPELRRQIKNWRKKNNLPIDY